MKTAFSKNRIAGLAVRSGMLSVAALVATPLAHAQGSYVSTWAGIYPASAADDKADCQLCHASSTQQLNPYGADICSSGAGTIANRIRAVERVNSDSDPTAADNIAEINASTQPGWTPGDVNPTYSRSNCSPTGLVEAPPTFIAGDLDPALGNQPPVASANGPYSGTVNVPLTFDASGSNDPDGSIVSYNWDFGDGSTGTGASPTYTYFADGTFTVTLTVMDDAGDTGTATSTATIGVGNQPPVADASGPYNGMVGTAVTFDGTGSNDPDGSIVHYSWDFGDGTSGSGATPTHTYATANMYNVTLTVTDDAGATDSAATMVEVTMPPVNQPPSANANGPYSGMAGEPVMFDASGSNDPDGIIASYSWDFGDGVSGSGAMPTHSYATDGNYTVTLTVMDDAGDSATDTATVSIGSVVNQPPVAESGGPYSGTVGAEVAFDGSSSSDVDGTITTYAWDFGDGTSGMGKAPTHSYATEGRYTVTLTVTDDAGAYDAATTSASIGAGNQPPVAQPGGPYGGTVGIEVAFDGSASGDPDGSIVGYHWDFGDGTTGSGMMPRHGYAAAGNYHVTLEVTDDSGAVDAAMTTAAITADGDGADVSLTRLQLPGSVKLRTGQMASRDIRVLGAGTGIAQDASVSLSVLAPAGVTVEVNPASLSRLVSPEDDSATYKFRANISCDVAGTHVVEWTATIAAAQNGFAGNDTLTDTTTVRCGKQGNGHGDSGEKRRHSDQEED